jgi:flagellar hook-associated protein 1 FlgK
MPTLTSGISIALQAVLAHSQALEVTEHNVANASTPGYRRQSLLLTASVPTSANSAENGIGAGQRGGGVTVQRIQRFNLAFFDSRYRSVSAEQQNWQAQTQILTQLEPLMAEAGEDGLLNHLNQFWAGWDALAADPTDLNLRSVLLTDANALALGFNRRATQLTVLSQEQNQAVASQVEQINNLAGQVAHLNGEISRVLAAGEQPNDLMDKRDLALDQLAELGGAVSFEQKNGESLVSLGGHALVIGHDALRLETRPLPSASGIDGVYWSDGQALSLAAGSLKGVLQVRDSVLPAQLNGLNTLAAELASQVNAVHSAGYGLANETGLPFFVGSDAASLKVNSALTASSLAAASALNQPGNNLQAAQLSALRTQKSLSAGTASLNEFYLAQITALGAQTSQAAQHNAQQSLVRQALGDQREAAVGVNLDEEAANMAKAQKAYQAAARLMTAYDDLLDTVINRMGMVGR